eukprot:872048-Rhodomonas_salina.1
MAHRSIAEILYRGRLYNVSNERERGQYEEVEGCRQVETETETETETATETETDGYNGGAR